MSATIGWRFALAGILSAGATARAAPPWDEQARAREVHQRVAAARRFPIWPAVLSAAAFFILPNGSIWAGLVLVAWGIAIYRILQSANALADELEPETRRLRKEQEVEAGRIQAIVGKADRGDSHALRELLSRWTEHLPPSLAGFGIDLRGSEVEGWDLNGHGFDRNNILGTTPRIGRGGRTFQDKRKAADIDEDLAELSAAGVLSALIALFSSIHSRKIRAVIQIPNPATGELVPWVTLAASISGPRLQEVIQLNESPSNAIRRLGGDVGRCRNQRLTAARPLADASDEAQSVSIGRKRRPIEPPQKYASSATQPMPPIESSDRRNKPDKPRQFSPSAVALQFGDAGIAAATVQPLSVVIPPAPARLKLQITVSSPISGGFTGEFSKLSRRYASATGDVSAPFVPFQCYWPSYDRMSAEQLRFFFKWRDEARSGRVTRTDLSYIFVHVYELLHLIGAANGQDAGGQLERLWINYRSVFPKLDTYLVRWLSDLYATESGTDEAIAFMRRAILAGASASAHELMLVTDLYWAAGDYGSMPQQGLNVLTGDSRLGENKFYREHNDSPIGFRWVDRAYRQALIVVDEVYASTNTISPREAEIRQFGLQPIVREAFQGAVYDWKRKQVQLGKTPYFSETGEVVLLYRNAARYTENILRKERDFGGRLRGVDVAPPLVRALDVCIADYIRSTKPRTRVTIDLAKAQELERQSVDVRARLLDGIENREPSLTESRVETAPSSPISSNAPALPPHVPPDLLTDLIAVQSALAKISPAAQAMLSEIMVAGWEIDSTAPTLLAATGGALVGPLVDEINEQMMESVGDILIVHEGENFIVEDDLRDEVHWVMKGTLDGFTSITGMASLDDPESSTDEGMREPPMVDGFGPFELQVLATIFRTPNREENTLASLAAARGITPLLLLDHLNEIALASPYGDILFDGEASPPILLPETIDYVRQLLERIQPSTT